MGRDQLPACQLQVDEFIFHGWFVAHLISTQGRSKKPFLAEKIKEAAKLQAGKELEEEECSFAEDDRGNRNNIGPGSGLVSFTSFFLGSWVQGPRQPWHGSEENSFILCPHLGIENWQLLKKILLVGILGVILLCEISACPRPKKNHCQRAKRNKEDKGHHVEH